MTTLEKLHSLIGYLRTAPVDELDPQGRDLAEILQIVAGFGFDPLAMLIPQSEAEADLLVDKCLTLLFSLRGDDLPPFDLARYGEVIEEEAPSE